jgi:hypothetical protein
MTAKASDLAWFCSFHFGQHDPNVNYALWWATLPDGRLHVQAEQRRANCTIATIARDMRGEARRLRIPTLLYTVCDEASIGKQDVDGESRADTFRNNGVPVRVRHVDPVQGWTRVRELLGLRPDRRPWLTIDPSCVELIRALTHAAIDPKNVENVDREFPRIYAINALRTGAMSRPAPKPFQRPPLPEHAIGRLVDEIRTGGGSDIGLAWRSKT